MMIIKGYHDVARELNMHHVNSKKSETNTDSLKNILFYYSTLEKE